MNLVAHEELPPERMLVTERTQERMLVAERTQERMLAPKRTKNGGLSKWERRLNQILKLIKQSQCWLLRH